MDVGREMRTVLTVEEQLHCDDGLVWHEPVESG